MFKDLDVGQTRSFEPSVPEQAGNVNRPWAWVTTPTDKAHFLLKREVGFAKPVDKPDWVITPLCAIPEGYRITKIEPDNEMRLAGYDAFGSADDLLIDVFRAMCAASPMNVPPPSTQEFNGWISVKDRLPECEGTACLVYYQQDERFDLDYWMEGCWADHEEYVQYVATVSHQHIFPPSHWMPLPNPPSTQHEPDCTDAVQAVGRCTCAEPD